MCKQTKNQSTLKLHQSLGSANLIDLLIKTLKCLTEPNIPTSQAETQPNGQCSDLPCGVHYDLKKNPQALNRSSM